MHMREVRVRPCATRRGWEDREGVAEFSSRERAVIGLARQPNGGRIRGVERLDVATTAAAAAAATGARRSSDAGKPGDVSSGVVLVDPEGVARPTGEPGERIAGS